MLGGDTVFMKTAKAELCRVTPQRGMALLHAHGRRCLLHEGEEVRRGVKYLLRADIMYRRRPAEAAAQVDPKTTDGGKGMGRKGDRAGGRASGRGGRRGGGGGRVGDV